MLALKSTKNLTGFKDFNFNSTSSLFMASSSNTSRLLREPSNEGLKNKINTSSQFSGIRPSLANYESHKVKEDKEAIESSFVR